MPTSRRHASTNLTELIHGYRTIRREYELPDRFGADAIAEATAATPHSHTDRTALPFLSLDPAGSRDLDQALYIERRGSTLRLHYAIADVATWVTPGGAIDVEVARRGATVYCPDLRVPLHPTELSEGRASLLPGQDTPAVLWRIDITDDGDATLVDVERAMIRNRLALAYETADREGDADQLALVTEVGRRRRAKEVERGGVDLQLPEQDVELDEQTGRAAIVNRAPTPIEADNAQLSLTCGMMAARVMLAAGFGVLRTMPSPDEHVVDDLRRMGRALGVPFHDDERTSDWIRRLDPSTPVGVALMTASARMLRGAGYEAFDGTLPELTTHSAIAAPYSHVTAPLRRRVDRYATECALTAVAGERPPEWVLAALDELPSQMGAANQTVSTVDRACVDLTEAYVLSPLVGDTLDGVVIGPERDDRVAVYLADPVVLARAGGEIRSAREGDEVKLRIDSTDLDTRTVNLSVVT